jgi:hypothetical protein
MTFTKADSFVFCDYNVTLEAIRKQDRIDRWVARARRALDVFLILCGIVAIIGINAGCDPGRGERDALGPQSSANSPEAYDCIDSENLDDWSIESYCVDGVSYGHVVIYRTTESQFSPQTSGFRGLLGVHAIAGCTWPSSQTEYWIPATSWGWASSNVYYWEWEWPLSDYSTTAGGDFDARPALYMRCSGYLYILGMACKPVDINPYCPPPCNCPHEDGPTRHETIKLLSREAAKP